MPEKSGEEKSREEAIQRVAEEETKKLGANDVEIIEQ